MAIEQNKFARAIDFAPNCHGLDRYPNDHRQLYSTVFRFAAFHSWITCYRRYGRIGIACFVASQVAVPDF